MGASSPTDFITGNASEVEQDEDEDDKKKLAAEEKTKEKEKEKEKTVEPTKVIRQQRDEFKQKYEEAQKRIEELSDLQPFTKVKDYLKSKGAEKIDEKIVDQFIDKNRSRKKDLLEAKKIIEDKDNKLKEVSIELSDEWNNVYRAKIKDATDSLFSEIAPIVDGEVKNPEMVDKLRLELCQVDKEGNNLSKIQIKGILSRFAKKYEEATGFEYEIPSLENVKKAVDSFSTSVKRAYEAKGNWEATIEKKREEEEYEKFEADKKRSAMEVEARNRLRASILDEIQEDQFPGFKIDEVKTSLENTFDYMNDIITGKKKPKHPKEGMLIMAKGVLYDDLAQRYKELEKKVKNNSGLPRNSSDVSSSKDSPKREETKPGQHPATFLGA